MRKSYFFLWVLLLFYGISGVGYGQQVIGNYPDVIGGFESATIDNSVFSAAQTGKWVKNNASTTIGSESTIWRSGATSLVITNNTTTGRRVWSPLISVSSTTSSVTIQYYRYVPNTTNTQQSQPGVLTATEGLQGTYTVPSSSGTWEKVTYNRSSTTFTSLAGVIMTRQTGTGGNVYIDDLVLYNGSIDNTAPNSPTAAVVNNPSTSSLDVSWTAASGGVDGGGYVVVRYATNPNADNDPNQNGIYAVGNTITNGTGSLTGTVRYIGTGTSFTDNSGLSAGTTYYYKVYTVDKAFNYSAEASGSGSTFAVEPTSQSTNISFTTVGSESFTINWTSGNGANRIVLLREGSAVTFVPNDGTAPPGSVSGDILETSNDGNGNFFIYNGSGNSVDVSNLNPGTTYHVAIYEYNGSGTAVNYLTTSPATGNQTTTGAGTPTITTSTTSFSSFGNVIAGSNSGEGNFTVEGSSLSEDIVVTAPTGFQVSTTSGSGFGNSVSLTPSSGTVSTTTIYVRFSPGTASGAFSGNITNTSTGAEQKNVAVSGNALDTEPTTQSAITIGAVTANSIVVNFSGGNGEKRIIVARQGNAVSFVPTDAAAVTGVNADFATAADQGSGNKIVYDGTGSTVTVTGLTEGTVYHFSSYEYNEGTGTSQNYLTTTPGVNNATTSGISVSVNSLTSFGNIAVGSVSNSANYTVSATGLSENLLITTPAGFEISENDETFGETVTLIPSGGTVPATPIYVRFAPVSTGSASTNITHASEGVTAKNISVSGFGLSAEPTTQASGVNFSSVGQTGITINWTSGNGSSRLVVMRSGSAVNSDPVDGTSYTADAAFGSGNQIGTGNYVVYNSNGSSVAVTGLTSGTTYHVAVYEYNGGSGSENYRTSDEATGSQMTNLNAVYFDGSATYTQDFNTLASSGTSSTVPTGWYFTEVGGNTTYTANAGGTNTGDTYSYGTGTETDRAFGMLRTGSLVPTIGMALVNNTGSTITDLPIYYVGEQWRLGTTGRQDRLDFQYSTNATSLSTGDWFDFDGLDFNAPITTGTTGALPGNNTANRATVAATLTGISIANGSAIWIRWNDFDATSSDDGLAVDDFQIVVQPATQASSVNFTSVTTTGFTINWTNGSGSNRVVLLKSGSAVDSDPVDGTTYTANAAFGSGTQIGTGNYVVYNGSGTSVAVTGLASGVTYYAAVYEYDGLSTVTNYLTTSPATGNQTTLAPAIALSSPSQVVTGNIFKGSDDNVISKFQLAVTTAQATVTSISVPLAGTYLAADIKASGLKLWYNTTNEFSGATQLGTSQSSASEGTGETVSFSLLSQNISADATGYFFVTASIANEAGDERTIYAAAMSADNFTVSSGDKSGTTTQGGTQTIIANPEPVITITADPALTEENLNGAVVTITLTNVEFADDQFEAENFTLNNVPESITIGSLEYVSTSSARCTLSYDGTDFDANITTFNITILDGEFSGSPGNLTSDNLTITATVEVVPTVTTNEAITSKSSTTAVWGGEATATGGESIFEKGIVWSTSSSPTVALGTKTIEEAGLGAITGNMTGLSPNTTYYVRAYATNSVGTGYGTERSFTTDGLGTPPTASAATNITSTGFTANWGSVSGASSYRLDVATDENFTSNTILSENFVGFTTNNGTTDRSGSLNTYLQTTGWTGTAIYEMIGYAKLGAGSTRGVITTPTVDLSGNSGNHILEFDLGKFGTDNTSVEVYHAPDGTTFAQVGTDIVAPASITTQTVQIAGGTAASKLRIQANLASSNRFYLDNFIVKTSNILTSHNNKEVNGTSENVSGLSSGTTYYYRVRGFSANSTSGNSGVITVRTADNSQSASVSTGNNVSAPVNGATGVEEVLFTSVATGGNINVARFNEPPTGGTSGITGNISQYRLIIEPDNVLVFDEQAGYKLRFKASDLPGITTRPENLNTTSVRLHKRSTPGSGDFSAAITMTYYRNEDPALDYLESDLITNGFSEFIFSSPDQPLPVELVSFTAKVKSSAVHLQWETATEVNNYGFEVERSNAAETMNASSTKGRTWQKIGFVEGNGNSNSPKSYSFTDRNASAGKYIYRLKQVDTDGAFDYSDEVAVDLGTPAQFSLSQNYPNPFNPSTLVQYAVPVQSVVVLEIYDITGTRVAQPVNALHEPGSYSALFNLTDLNLASGTYIYRLSANDMSGNILYSAINKMLLLK